MRGWPHLPRSGSVQQSAQVVDRIDTVQPAGLDQTDQYIADIGAVLVAIEQTVVAITHDQLERLFGEIIIERSAWDVQKPCQPHPVFEQIGERPTEAAVGLHLVVVELLFHPALERAHHRCAMGLMIGQTLFGGELVLFALGVVVIDRGDGLDHPGGFTGEVLGNLDELASTVGQALHIHHALGMALGGIGRERIGHPQHRWQCLIAQRQDVIEVLTGVLAASEIQTDRAFSFEAQYGGVHRLALGRGIGLIVLDQRKDPRTGIVLIDQWLLGTEELEVFEHRIDAIGERFDELPLGGIG
jgi:hypothetical protein